MSVLTNYQDYDALGLAELVRAGSVSSHELLQEARSRLSGAVCGNETRGFPENDYPEQKSHSYSRAFGDGLFELRPRGRSGIGRAFYCFLVGKRVVVLHAFIKKSRQTPDQEIKLARKRLKEIQND
jgi:hypothetical protein